MNLRETICDLRSTLALLACVSCVSPYDIELVSAEPAIVVHGSLTNEELVHEVRISYAFGLDDDRQQPVEGASVWIAERGSEQMRLFEERPGRYRMKAPFAGQIGEEYQLNIELEDGTTLSSGWEELLPPIQIDSIYGRYHEKPSSNATTPEIGMQFLFDAQSSSEEFSNYRIDFEEVYQISVPFPSAFSATYENQVSRTFSRDSMIGTCYASSRSKEFVIATTKGLTTNRISEFPLVFASVSGPKLVEKYSIAMRQFTISGELYEYYRVLNEINLSAGTFFDTQKGTVLGNIDLVEGKEIRVLGLFEVAGVAEKQQIFEPKELFNGQKLPEHSFCKGSDVRKLTVALSDVGRILQIENVPGFHGPDWRIYRIATGVAPPGPYPPTLIYWRGVVGQTDVAIIVHKSCSDCREYGKLKKPEFWD